MQACTASTIRRQHMFWNDLVVMVSFQPSKIIVNHLLLVVKLAYGIMYWNTMGILAYLAESIHRAITESQLLNLKEYVYIYMYSLIDVTKRLGCVVFWTSMYFYFCLLVKMLVPCLFVQLNMGYFCHYRPYQGQFFSIVEKSIPQPTKIASLLSQSNHWPEFTEHQGSLTVTGCVFIIPKQMTSGPYQVLMGL